MDADVREHILEQVERFVRERVDPRAASVDEEDEFPRDLWNEAAQLGLFGLGIPEDYGGLGRDVLTPLLISERIARSSASFALTFNNTTDATVPIVTAASKRMKKRYLPAIARGEVIPCISISEARGGSDVLGMETRASRDGDSYVLDGQKMWCTNGAVGDVFTVFAKTNPEAGHKGLSGFLVDRNTPGFEVGRTEKLVGLHGSPVTELIFDGARVSREALLGGEGGGFRLAMVTLDESRLHCSATALGVAAAALEYAIAYARDRVQFGKPIIEHQGLHFLLAELVTDMTAARTLWEDTALRIVTGHDRAASAQAAMTKAYCTDLAMRVTTEAVQVCGASGLTRSLPLERYMRDAKAFQIFDGTSQIQKSIIGRYLAKGGIPLPFLRSRLD